MHPRKQIVIVGGGVAALETAIGLHESPNVEVGVKMIAPHHDFHYRPFAVLEPFGFHEYARMSIRDLVAGCNVELVHDKVSRVDLTSKRVVLAKHPLIEFDALVVASGAGQVEAVRGATTVGGPDSTKHIQHLLREIDSGIVGRVAFVAPPGASWTLPIYEFALLTAARAQRQLSSKLHVIVATPEKRPLDAFGDEASERIARMLAEAGIELRTAVRVQSFSDGVLTTAPQKEIEADRVIALPHLVGRRIPGLPHDANGFLPIDLHGHVADTDDVYAAGDIADFPVKQGSIAAQQADAVVAALAAHFGTQQDSPPFHPQLHAVLFSEHGRTFLRAADHGGPHGGAAVSEEPLWEDAEKIFSKHLSQRMRRLRAAEMKMATR